MHTVGRHLESEAIKKNIENADALARSAFNRYYYSTFLTARELLSTKYPKVEEIGHKAYSEIFSQKIPKELKKHIKTAQTTDPPLVVTLQKAVSAAYDLSEIMKKAYGVRIVADYNPNTKVEFTIPDKFKLNGVSISDAHSWQTKAKQLTACIQEAWRQTSD